MTHIWWNIAQVLKSVQNWKTELAEIKSEFEVIKSIWIGLKFGMHDLDLWYKLLYKCHENWIRIASVLKWILSTIVQQFLSRSSGGRFDCWQFIWSQMKLNFLQLLDDLIKHISAKFHGIWICSLGVMDYSLNGTESARKVTIIGFI